MGSCHGTVCLFLELLGCVFLEPKPHNPCFVATDTKLEQSLPPVVLLSLHHPVSSLARVAVALLLRYISVEHENVSCSGVG